MSCEPLLKIVKGLWFCLLIQFVLCCTSEFFVFLFTSELWVNYKSPTHTLQHTFSVFWSIFLLLPLNVCDRWEHSSTCLPSMTRASSTSQSWRRRTQWRASSPTLTSMILMMKRTWVPSPHAPTTHCRSVMSSLPIHSNLTQQVSRESPTHSNSILWVSQESPTLVLQLDTAGQSWIPYPLELYAVGQSWVPYSRAPTTHCRPVMSPVPIRSSYTLQVSYEFPTHTFQLHTAGQSWVPYPHTPTIHCGQLWVH